jgi:hypothetical protein
MATVLVCLLLYLFGLVRSLGGSSWSWWPRLGIGPAYLTA